MSKQKIIAIDGYSGTGKSSTAKIVAKKLKYRYIDTGAMYRAVTLYLLRNKIPIDSIEEVEAALDEIHLDFRVNSKNQSSYITLNGEAVEEYIRGGDVARNVSAVAAISAVRRKLVSEQRAMGEAGGVVMDGRDIGTVVFPNAALKIFMSAGLEIRARRRLKELKEKNIEADLSEVMLNLKERDIIDSGREDSPLMKAKDAITIETDNITLDQQVEIVLKHCASI